MKSKQKLNLSELYIRYGIVAIFLLVFIVASIISPAFLSLKNITNVLSNVAIVSIMSFGMTLVIITANIDLSAGSVAGFASVLCAYLINATGSLAIGILAALCAGVICNVISGFLISYLALNNFIITLAMQMIARSMAQIVTNGLPIYGVGRLIHLGQGYLLGLPVVVWIMFVLLVVIWYLLSQTIFGRYLYAIGGNREAAVASGIDVNKTVMGAFVIMGLMSAVAGVLLTAKTNSGQPTAGTGFEFDAIIACVLGGTSLLGGVGNVFSSLMGALVIGIINNAMNLVGVYPFYQQLVKGFIIIAAILIDKKTRNAVMKEK